MLLYMLSNKKTILQGTVVFYLQSVVKDISTTQGCNYLERLSQLDLIFTWEVLASDRDSPAPVHRSINNGFDLQPIF